jgi:hypothetical protein
MVSTLTAATINVRAEETDIPDSTKGARIKVMHLMIPLLRLNALEHRALMILIMLLMNLCEILMLTTIAAYGIVRRALIARGVSATG